ncbi:hypothetical protein B0O80DRAFT_424438 [Mortierella sp. GBAus27b]|nr:hypothetical protein B0O80DRAFT_424438 [Mortierella sp. GBAus27b]
MNVRSWLPESVVRTYFGGAVSIWCWPALLSAATIMSQGWCECERSSYPEIPGVTELMPVISDHPYLKQQLNRMSGELEDRRVLLLYRQSTSVFWTVRTLFADA